MKHIIDAKNKKLGRLASEIAVLLQGKNKPDYNPRLEGSEVVHVTNIKEVELTGSKASSKIYYRHAGQLGHLKEKKFKDVFERNPGWVLRHAVRLMLPKNKLQTKRLKRLVIE